MSSLKLSDRDSFNLIYLPIVTSQKVFSITIFAYIFQVSPRMHGFLDKMLVRDPSQRATAAELLHHPFLRQAGHPALLVPLMRQFRNSPTWYIALMARRLGGSKNNNNNDNNVTE